MPTGIDTSLVFVGRGHDGPKELGGNNDGTISVSGFDVRVSNFLHLDGHVETQTLDATVFPNFDWGDASTRPAANATREKVAGK